jgi:hypothetical protein
MTAEDWQAFSEALTFPNGKPTQRGKWWVKNTYTK